MVYIYLQNLCLRYANDVNSDEDVLSISKKLMAQNKEAELLRASGSRQLREGRT